MNYQLKSKEKSLNAIEQVFINRGFKKQDIYHYLNTTDDDICNPLLLDNIEKAAKILIQHIKNNDDIFLPVDPDCDGMTSAAIFINYLYKLFPTYVSTKIFYNFPQGKSHGVQADNVPANIKLVVAIDSSSSSYEETAKLAERGIDVIVLDHHESDYPDFNAVIVNNQLCDYPTKTLSGAGISYKFCSYIDNLLNTNYAENLLDLAALGMIADMVSLKDFETRRLITKGLNNIQNIFLDSMVERNRYSLGENLTPIGIAFYIAPYINATIRSGTVAEKLTLFESMLDHLALRKIPSTKRGCKGQTETQVEQAVRNCINIKKRQTTARDKYYDMLSQIIKENNLLSNKILTVCIPKDYGMDKNLTGLLANQFMAEYQRPALILNETKDAWEGSGRGYGFTSFREFLQSTGLINWATGHPNAMGCSISKSQLKNFIDYTNKLLKDKDFSPKYEVDFIYDGYNFNSKDVIDLAELKGFWGQEVEEPLIAIENVKITKENIILMSPDKSPTLKITLPNGIELIKFKSSQEEFDALKPIETGALTLTVIGTCDANYWNGSTTGQILIKDYEITKEIKFYF